MGLIAGEWLALGIGLGTLATAVSFLIWRVFGRDRP
jgi:hypothetical protein